jgi:hypothetical protein
VVENISLQNILFQWQVSNATGNLNLSQLSYQIDLYEVNNSWTNPFTSILNSQALPIWQSPPIHQNSYLYTAIEPVLEKGKRYVFTVRAQESNGRCSFKNNGYSMPSYFYFGYHENDTIEIIKPADNFQFTLGTASQFKWKKPRKALFGQMVVYTLRIVEVSSGQDPANAIVNNLPFYQQAYLGSNDAVMDKTIPVTFWASIKRMGNYAWQVSAQSGNQEVAKSAVLTFTGPPEIESFIAGGFLMTVTKLTSFNETTNVISGSCKTNLNVSWNGLETEFNFNNITVTPIGNNEYVMLSGNIADKIATPSYTLSPQTYSLNQFAFFMPDSVLVNTSGLKLSGLVEWNFPHPGTAQQFEKITSAKCRLSLANTSFYLANSSPMHLSQNYNLPVMEPYGFAFDLNQSSAISIYQSKYEFNFNGFVKLPASVPNENYGSTLLAFQNSNQLFYITQLNNQNSEGMRLAQNVNFYFKPTSYVIDLHEKQSPGEFAADSAWKGVYITAGQLQVPKITEGSGQVTASAERVFNFTNTVTDTNRAFVTNRGFHFTGAFNFSLGDSIKFNRFVSKQGYFYSKIEESEIKSAFIKGGIYIPVIDTLNSFAYTIPLTDQGFQEGYLNNGLANTTFTFNQTGSPQQKIPITIKRAVFRGKDHLEMDLDLTWPYFNLGISGANGFCVWGNGNIGFQVPNGKSALTFQSTGKAGNFDITVDYLGCGRNGNAYAFGASAKINMDEEISGDAGPPVMNAYSIYKNPLLTGLVFIPVTTTLTAGSSTGSANSSTYQSATSSHTNSVNNGMMDALEILGFHSSDTTHYTNQFNDDHNLEPLVNGNTITQIQKLIDIVYRLKPFINEADVSNKDWEVVDRFRTALNTDLVLQGQTTNGKGLLNFILNKVVTGVVSRINQPIANVSNQAIGKVRTAMSGLIVTPVNNQADASLAAIFTRLQNKVLSLVEEESYPAVIATFSVVRGNIAAGIKTSVAASFEDNVTSKMTGFIEMGVTAKVTGFIRKEVTGAGNKLITEGANADINLGNLLQNAGSVLAGISDTIRDVIMTTNSKVFLNTAESLVNDAIAGIDWSAVANQVLNQLMVQGISSVVSNQLSAAVSANAGPYVSAILNVVKFDFSNLGEKLQNGQFNKIVKFDPTNIYIVSPAVDVQGQVVFTKDDPVYGDSWQASVAVRVKVPNKDHPLECSGYFLNGKTTQLSQNFSYWYVKLGVQGLNVPMLPTPITWDGVEGYFFSKMQKTGLTTVVPNSTNKFGLGCKFYFYDTQTNGKSILFDLGAEANFDDGGFAIQLLGNASILNYQKIGNKLTGPGFITGTGNLGYYKTPSSKMIAGNFTSKFNTEPVLCAGGDIGFELKTPNDWKTWIGTQQSPIGVKVLCKDFLSNTAFIQFNQSGLNAGLGMNVSLSAQSPWLEFTGIKVRGFASMNFGYNAYASIVWEPTFKINEATVSAWASAAIGVEYEVSSVTNTLTLAGVSLAGTLTYKSVPEAELHGNMNGNITILNYNLEFTTPVNYSLSKQQIIN